MCKAKLKKKRQNYGIFQNNLYKFLYQNQTKNPVENTVKCGVMKLDIELVYNSDG